jgi:2',3'-cyclic-nucleotide 2'-phosphodiesterase (5'-nucleotidase family)
MKHPRPAILFALSFCMFLFVPLVWMNWRPIPRVVDQGPTFYFSGDTAGWITPCGCTAGQSGGLARRATIMQESRAQSVYLDVGGAASGTSDYHQMKFEAILMGEMLMNVRAHNLGQSELAFAPDRLMEVSDRTKVPLLSTNTRDTTNQFQPKTHLIISCSGQKALIVGVVDPSLIENAA